MASPAINACGGFRIPSPVHNGLSEGVAGMRKAPVSLMHCEHYKTKMKRVIKKLSRGSYRLTRRRCCVRCGAEI